MKPTTEVWLAAKNVGNANDSLFVTNGQFVQTLMSLTQWLGEKTMRVRFDIAIGRSESEVTDALKVRSRGPGKAMQQSNELFNDILAQMLSASDNSSEKEFKS